jgi:hypothetical protein
VARPAYYHETEAPPANAITPTAFAAVRDDQGRLLLVRRSDSGNWELPGGRVELGETAMNEPLLRELATTTAGAFFREEDLYKLPDTINLKTEHVRSPLEVELWASPLYFLIMLLVVATEWVLRKMSYLK